MNQSLINMMAFSIFGLMALFLIMGLECPSEDKPPNLGVPGIYGISFTGPHNDAIGQYYKFNFSDNTNSNDVSYYYIVAKTNAYDIVAVSQDYYSGYPPLTNAFVNLYYSDFPYQIDPASTYSFYIYACDFFDYPNNDEYEYRKYVGEIHFGSDTTVTEYCTRIPDFKKRKYTRFERITSCIEASVKIKARYGVPCGYPDNMDSLSMNFTWVSMGKDYHNPQSDIPIWGQVGVGWLCYPQFTGDSDIWHAIYHETMKMYGQEIDFYFNDDQEGDYDYINPPDEGEEWTYWCMVDTVEGEWYYSVNGLGFLPSLKDSAWLTPPTGVVWASEIGVHYEDDMAGTLDNPCVLSEMSLRTVTDNSIQFIEYEPGDTAFSDDPAEWHIERQTATELIIRDINPNSF
ncbi:MAG: hypothetical protein CVT49_07440 [candidate division Zixibacteria bacterium HGW-Zixibacteria-1]|nr:MAG: hypothetical protein CVT49_07440 [candidate division Zixibacteria bacterium HGW-Zixibacteria-1]